MGEHTHDQKHNLVQSADGTLISYGVAGGGPGLIVVPGVMAVAGNYQALAQSLSAHFTVYTIERRGRGLSGPQGEAYSMEKECDDIQALKQATQARYLFGHSYGGLIALEAGLKTGFDKIAVYEPGVSVNGSIRTSWMRAYARLLAAGRPLSAFALFTGSNGTALAQLMPPWMMKAALWLKFDKAKRSRFYELLPANLNEHRAIAQKNNAYPAYKALRTPVLLMRGSGTGLQWPARSVDTLSGVLPLSQTEVLPGLDHFGPERSPQNIARVLARYFLAP